MGEAPPKQGRLQVRVAVCGGRLCFRTVCTALLCGTITVASSTDAPTRPES
jgi:hypothetical protein